MADYISREAAIVDFEKHNQENPAWTPQRVKTLLMRIPAADVEPVRRWIPCSERPPEEDDTYLCVYRFPSSQKSRCTTMFFYATDPNPHFQYENYHGIKITHWLPTPPLPNQEIGEK